MTIFFSFMCRFFLSCLLLCAASAFVAAQEKVISDQSTNSDAATNAPNNSAEQTANDVEEILVTGEQPGPNLVKIYKGDHVLYVLGLISPLPKDMQWKSKQVEEAVANSQAFIYPPEIKLEIGFWSKVALLPSLIGIKNNPDGKKLSEVMPAALYERWTQLKSKYMGNNSDVEKMRPIFAAAELMNQALQKSGLVPADPVRWRVEAVVKNNKIAVVRPTIQQPVQNASSSLKKFKKSQIGDLECFSKMLERMETDLDAMKLRANAWSLGDMEKLKQLPPPDDAGACEAVIFNSELMEDIGLHDIKKLLTTTWVNAAKESLEKNNQSFAFLSTRQIFDSQGYIAWLIAEGYEVEY